MLHINPWLSVNQKFLWTGHTCVNKWKQSRGLLEIVGVMKWYMQMSTWDFQSIRVCVSLEPVPTCTLGERSQRPPVEYSQPRSRRIAKWSPENNASRYALEKKLWVNITGCICLPPSVRPSVCLTYHRDLTLFERMKRHIYIFIQKYCVSFFFTVYNSKMLINGMYLIYKNKQDLGFNNLQRFLWQTKPNQGWYAIKPKQPTTQTKSSNNPLTNHMYNHLTGWY